MVNLRDVAREAGVSTSAASRALDERLPPGRSEAAERVRRVAAELGYVRDPLASGLRRAPTSTVGVIVPRLTDPQMSMFYEELAAAARRRGLFSLVVTTGDDPEQEARALQELARRRVDGFVSTTARLDTSSPVPPGVREVLALRSDGVLPASVGDDRLGGTLATRHLIELGHRRIGLIGGADYLAKARDRRGGYLDALAEAGIGPDPSLILSDAISMENGRQAAHDLLERQDRPTAVFAINDSVAIGALSVAAALGLRVPDDLSIVGYNDIPIVGMLPVPLTTVRVPFDQIAEGALGLLLDHKEDESAPGTLVFAPTLVVRQSTCPPPGDGGR